MNKDIQKPENIKDASIEDIFQELERVAAKLEAEDLPLEEGFSLYETGRALLSVCEEKLDKTEEKMRILDEGADA